MDITTAATEQTMYLAGLASGLRSIARRGMRAHPGRDWLLTSDKAHPIARAYAEGDADADDDSDEPREDDAACLAAIARLVSAELGRIGASVSAWPDYRTGYVRLDDGLTDEAHDAETLLATLRALPDGAGTMAMWEATTPIAVACLSWGSFAVRSEGC